MTVTAFYFTMFPGLIREGLITQQPCVVILSLWYIDDEITDSKLVGSPFLSTRRRTALRHYKPILVEIVVRTV